MDKPRDLYHDEIKSLREFREKLDLHAIYKEDLDEFSDQYEDLVAQAKVITRVSDRLQKKLDSANIQIKDQNVEIKDKNLELEDTIGQLAQAKVGRRAATVMLTIALGLFILEQVFLQPIIDNFVAQYVDESYVFIGSLTILLILFFLVKFFEKQLENYFMNKEKKRIMEHQDEPEE